jgi:hypothetical protein
LPSLTEEDLRQIQIVSTPYKVDNKEFNQHGIPLTLYYKCNVALGGGNFVGWNLYCDNLSNIGFSYEHEWSFPFSETVEKHGGTPERLLSIINSLNTIKGEFIDKANGTPQLISAYQEVPAYKDTSVLGVPNSLTFSFSFGQYGNFSGARDVVLPILSIAKLFTPTRDTNSSTTTDYPLPTAASMVGSVLGAAQGINIPALDEVNNPPPSEETDPSTEANEVKEAAELNRSIDIENAVFHRVSKIVEVYDKTVVPGFYSGKSSLCRFEIGSISSPVFSLGSVEFNFNFADMDDDGFPMSGTLTLGGLETLSMATQDIIR